MQVKRFVAADMRRALELVRLELGPDAVILSNRRSAKGVEVMASLEVPNKPEPSEQSQRHLAGSAAGQFDLPMASDQAWQQQEQFAEVAEKLDLAGASNPSTDFKPNSRRGLASGKTPEELAQEVANARERMLANEPKPIAARAQVTAETAASRAVVKPSFPRVKAQASDQAAAPKRGAGNNKKRMAQSKPQSMDFDNQMKVMMSELSDMRSLLEEQIIKGSSQTDETPLQSTLASRLKRMGLSETMVEKLQIKTKANTKFNEAWSIAMASLAKDIPVQAKDVTDEGGVFAFVGPTGVGKTTTVGKLAARYVMKHGPEQVALITTDTYRIAAHDQLRALGAILKVPVKVVTERDDLQQIIDGFSNRSLVLIDTAGFRHGDPMLHQQLELVQQHHAVRSYLVMAANNQWQMLKASAHAYTGSGLEGAILTKVDETLGLGDALSVIIEHELPLAYYTNGQNIPQDIAVANSSKLVGKAIELLEQQHKSTVGDKGRQIGA